MESVPPVPVIAAEELPLRRASTRSCKRRPVVESTSAAPVKKKKSKVQPQPQPAPCKAVGDIDSVFVGDPFPNDEAHSKWSSRYEKQRVSRRRNVAAANEEIKASLHYGSAKVDEMIYSIGDDVYVTAGENLPDYIGRITEFFQGMNGRRYFTCRWFFRAEDTVISHKKLLNDHTHDAKRVFLSDERNDNDLDCIVSKVKIIHVDPKVDPEAKARLVADADLYFNMSYSVAHSTFENITADINENSGISFDGEANSESDAPATKATLLDLYSGCGGMSTGLCMGAAIAGLQIETVRQEKVDDFLSLLKEWSVLCDKYLHTNNGDASASSFEDEGRDRELRKGKHVVEKLTAICYGGNADRKNCIYFKVQWKGHRIKDTWEPIEKLRAFQLKIKEFVQEGHRRKILPLPGGVDVLCAGPPCQGLSGNNRNRKVENPFEDEKNRQIVTFMDIVSFLKPKIVLMENVVDILKFDGGSVGRYAVSRLIALKYQSRMGLMVAGCYGLPQFRMRMLLWGALPTMVLPKYPLPTHDVVVRGGAPRAFSQSVVAYDENQKPTLKKALCLRDAISDLPEISNNETADVTEYSVEAKTEFQHYIRLSRKEMLDYSYGDNKCPLEGKLLDHLPLKLNEDDYERVKKIPYEKGANFRNLEGVKVDDNNVVYMDPTVEPVYLESGKPLVPTYALTFVNGKSLKPFGRLWWDETVSTVVTRAEPHNQAILHPDQARVLTVRENARLQGFPDYYRMAGPTKNRYMQVGNAVAVPVGRALGYALGLAYLRKTDENNNNPLIVLPDDFADVAALRATARASSSSAEAVEELQTRVHLGTNNH